MNGYGLRAVQSSGNRSILRSITCEVRRESREMSRRYGHRYPLRRHNTNVVGRGSLEATPRKRLVGHFMVQVSAISAEYAINVSGGAKYVLAALLLLPAGVNLSLRLLDVILFFFIEDHVRNVSEFSGVELGLVLLLDRRGDHFDRADRAFSARLVYPLVLQ